MNVQRPQRKQQPPREKDTLDPRPPWQQVKATELTRVEGGRFAVAAGGVTINRQLIDTVQKIWAKEVLETLGPGVIDPIGPVVDISNGF